MWLQVAPIAFKNIGWKFYMVFLSCAIVASITMYFTFPDTLNKPLEEVAAMFGDDDLVAHYTRFPSEEQGTQLDIKTEV